MSQSFWLKSQTGDYSGDTFDPTKKYIGVRRQQDVELLDRDWNELEDIRRYEELMLRKWYIGNGTPNDGFRIIQVEDPKDFKISPGRCQVDGFEAVNDTGISYLDQNDPETKKSLPDLTIPQGKRSDTVYLDVWIREISGLEDPDLMNPQDLTHETCRRHKIEWLVRVDEGRGVGSTEPLKKEDFHYYYDIARIDRDGAQVSFIDLRRTRLAVYLLKDSLDALGDLSVSLNDLKGSTNNLKILVDGLQSSQDALKSSQNNLENTVNDLNVSVNSLKVSENESSNSINALKSSLGDLNNSVNALKRSQGDLNNSVNALKSSQNVLTDKLTGGKMADGLHSHSQLVGSDGSPDPALIVDSNGNVGVGTNSPKGKLDVSGDIHAGNSDLYFTKTDHDASALGNTAGYAAIQNASDYGALMILGRAGTPKGRYVRLWDYLQVNGGMDITGNVGIGTVSPEAKLQVLNIPQDANGNTLILGPTNASNLRLGYHAAYSWVQSHGSKPLAINPIGNKVGIGTVSPEAKLQVLNIPQDANGNTLILGPTNASNLRLGYHADYSWVQSHGSKPLAINPIGNNVGIGTANPQAKLDVAGPVKCNKLITPSDFRFKMDIAPIKDVLKNLQKIRGVSFRWNELDPYGRSGDRREIGLIAQEVEEVFPELVTTWGDESYRGIDYNRLTSILVEAIKELKAENESFGRKIKDLEDAALRDKVGINS